MISLNYQRKGIGHQLLKYVIDEAIQRGFWKISLIVSETDPTTLAFYKSCGFEIEGVMKDQIKKGINGILLSYITDYSLHPNQ